MASIRFTDLFWDTLADHRQAPYYRLLRFKLLRFCSAKERSVGPVSAGDRPFSNPAMRDVWHLRLNQNPEVTLFYARRGDETVLAMIGNHSDYGFRGANARAEARTATRVNNATARDGVSTPGWPTLRWTDPLDLLNHPDLPEMSRDAMDVMLDELAQEKGDGARFEVAQGFTVLELDDHDFNAYMDDLDRAESLVRQLRQGRFPEVHWLRNQDQVNDFQARGRSLGR